ncbi:MAG TPA: ABC transporter permease subunit [Stellaceae bacterium]|nr:ABC transporter permease subunit [Stellaceae bacterium]
MSRGWLIVWAHRDELLQGLATTLWISALAALASLALGGLLSIALMSRHRGTARSARAFVDTMRCVPFLLFVYVVYYGLPSFGIVLGNWTAGLSALIVYNTGYMGELIAAAWRALPREVIEAGHAFGFHRFSLFRRIILPPVALAAAPMIGNQVVQIVKDSAFLTIIAVAELTHAATNIQSFYFVPFAAFLSAVLLYWVLCVAIEQGVGLAQAVAERRR